MTFERIDVIQGVDPEPNEWDEMLYWAETLEEVNALRLMKSNDHPLTKRLSAEWGQPGARRKRLVARLKRVRTYNPPVKGGRRKRRFK
jgi:hypothetical protein